MERTDIGPSALVLSRRAMLRLAVSGAGTLLVVACGSSAQPPRPVSTGSSPAAPSPTGASVSAPAGVSGSAKASGRPKTGGTLTYGGLDDITNLDGHVGSNPALDILFQVFDRLTEYDLKRQPQPRLAESWEVSKDAKQ
ncbi:MAG: hypothetical protein KGJ86_16850, partial [Chloroflexota bacterium]|nr:hypothetical protein [Chloroflexota bacterium]